MNQPALTFEQLQQHAPLALRQSIAAGHYHGHTSGLGQGRVQANIVILPSDWANEFLRYCALNRQACPLLDVTEPGDPVFRNLGTAIDIRHDVPRYRVYRHGELSEAPVDIEHLWQDDLVAFAIGALSIGEPEGAVLLDPDAVRENEHARAKALEQLAGRVEFQNRRQV